MQEEKDAKSQPRAQRELALTDEGYRNFKKSVAACTITNLTLMIPFSLSVGAFYAALTKLAGDPLAWDSVWWLVAIGVVGLVVVFLAARGDYRKTYIAAYTESKATRLGLAEHLRRLPMSFFNRRDLSELSENLMGDVTSQESLLTGVLPQLIASCISTAVVCLFLSIFDWRLALCMFCTLPAALLVVLASRRRERKLFDEQNAARIDAAARVQEYVEGIKDIRACRQVGTQSKPLGRSLLELRDIAFRVEVLGDVCTGLAQSILQVGIGLVVFVGTYLLTGGQIEFLTLLMFLLISSRIYGPMVAVMSNLASLLYLHTRTARMRALRDEPPAAGTRLAELGSHEIELADVRFAYGAEEVLKGVSFKMAPGTVTALVGPSGSGKSTAAQLVARFWSPDSGAVLVDGIDASEFDEESWLRNVSIVFQNVTLFDDTVMDNIRIGREGATDEEVVAAARAAHCDAFVERLPEGWNTRLGENGAKLSGGERQRVSIARALLKDAPIVLLDEATSSLDPENETLVQEAVGRLVAGKTVLVIAHRLRTIEGADNIVVLDSGCVAEQGPHGELMAADGLYARLHRIQQESAAWNIASGRASRGRLQDPMAG